jgi:hypothetical protein
METRWAFRAGIDHDGHTAIKKQGLEDPAFPVAA